MIFKVVKDTTRQPPWLQSCFAHCGPRTDRTVYLTSLLQDLETPLGVLILDDFVWCGWLWHTIKLQTSNQHWGASSPGPRNANNMTAAYALIIIDGASRDKKHLFDANPPWSKDYVCSAPVLHCHLGWTFRSTLWLLLEGWDRAAYVPLVGCLRKTLPGIKKHLQVTLFFK